jgi:alkylhydroperoxidase family enzyme
MRKSGLVCGLAVGLLLALPVQSADAPIARVPSVGENPSDPILQAMFKDVHDRGGQIINLQLVMGNAPALARAHQQMAYAIRFDAVTPRRLRELAITRAVQLMDGAYELSQHRAMMLACGYDQAQLAALKNWRKSTLFDERERAELAYIDQLVKRRGHVDDATYNGFAKFFNPQEIVEITMTVGSYVGTALLTNAVHLKIETDGRQAAIGKC